MDFGAQLAITLVIVVVKSPPVTRHREFVRNVNMIFGETSVIKAATIKYSTTLSVHKTNVSDIKGYHVQSVRQGIGAMNVCHCVLIAAIIKDVIKIQVTVAHAMQEDGDLSVTKAVLLNIAPSFSVTKQMELVSPVLRDFGV